MEKKSINFPDLKMNWNVQSNMRQGSSVLRWDILISLIISLDRSFFLRLKD